MGVFMNLEDFENESNPTKLRNQIRYLRELFRARHDFLAKQIKENDEFLMKKMDEIEELIVTIFTKEE